MANDSGSDGASHDQYVQGTGRIGILAGVGPWPASEVGPSPVPHLEHSPHMPKVHRDGIDAPLQSCPRHVVEK